MKEKTAKNNTERRPKTKMIAFDYHCDLAFREKPISIAAIEQLAEELFDWALNDDTARKLRPFFTARGISSKDVARWKKRCPKFKRACTLAQDAIGDRREDGGLTNKLNASIVLRGLALYDKEWKALEKWRSDLRKAEKEKEKEPTTFNINMSSFSKESDGTNNGDT